MDATQVQDLLTKVDLLFTNADLVVKSVLFGLATASLLTWAIAVVKACQLFTERRRARVAVDAIYKAHSLEMAQASLEKQKSAFLEFLVAAETEMDRSAGLGSIEGIKERIRIRLHRLEAEHSRKIMRSVSILESIGSTAPFVGLFGTVWVVLNTFLTVAQHPNSNLSLTAPGIADALTITACGLATALPAIIVHDLFSRLVSSYRSKLADANAEVMRLVGRDLDRQLPLAQRRV